MEQQHPGNLNKVLEATVISTVTITHTVTETATAVPLPPTLPPTPPPDSSAAEDRQRNNRELPHTTIVAHAPGWTLFNNLYMSNGTLYILTPRPKKFPEIRLMTSTGLEAANTPENIAMREPTSYNMDFITPDDALERWGGDPDQGETNRVWTVQGNTVCKSLSLSLSHINFKIANHKVGSVTYFFFFLIGSSCFSMILRNSYDTITTSSQNSSSESKPSGMARFLK